MVAVDTGVLQSSAHLSGSSESVDTSMIGLVVSVRKGQSGDSVSSLSLLSSALLLTGSGRILSNSALERPQVFS